MPQKLEYESSTGKEKGVVIFKHLEFKILCSAQLTELREEISQYYKIYCYVGFKDGISTEMASLCDGIICERFVLGDEILSQTHWIRLSGYNFIDPLFNPVDSRDEIHLDDRSKILLYVGNTQRRKRVFDFLRLALSLSMSFPGTYKFNIVLNDDGKFHSKLCIFLVDTLIKLSGIKVLRKHLGQKLTKSEIRSVMSQSSLLVHPSRKEGAARICAEALSIGLPVMISPACHDGTKNLLQFKNCFTGDSAQCVMDFFKSIADGEIRGSQTRDSFFDAEKSFRILTSQLEEQCGKKLKPYHGPKVGFLPCHTNRYPASFTTYYSDECASNEKLVRFAADELGVHVRCNCAGKTPKPPPILLRDVMVALLAAVHTARSFFCLMPAAVILRLRA